MDSTEELFREWNKKVPDPDYYHQPTNANGVPVVTWIARSGIEQVLFDPQARKNEALGTSDPRSVRGRAGSARLSGDSLGGSAVPSPRPKPKSWQHFGYPFLLRASFYARCYRVLGYVGIQDGKGNKPTCEVEALRRFLYEYNAKGWTQAQLVAATSRAKSTVAKLIADEAKRQNATLETAWVARREASAASRRVIREMSVLHPNYPTDTKPYWHEFRTIKISKPSEVPVPRRTDANTGRSDDPPRASLLRPMTTTTPELVEAA